MPSPRITVEDVDAFSDVSNGSTISVGSAASGGSGRMPRPPSGGSKRSKSVQGRRSHIAKSPYSSQQFKGTTKQLPPKPAARNMWITAMKNGTSSLSTENSPMRSWTTSRPIQSKTNKSGAGRTRHFSDAVQIGDLKNKNHVRSASLSASEPQVTPGGVAYKPKEDYYDEIIELKKIINALKAENNIINTKLHRVEGENVLKDRKMEDLLNSRKQPEDMRRTLTDRKGDTSAIVNSLKHKLHAVERTLKDKEAELSQLQRDLKMTNIEELQLQSETYYQEVQRLQLALIEMQQSQVREPLGNTTLWSHPLQKGNFSTHSLQNLTDENNHLRAENQGLKKDLLSAIENASTGGKKVPLKVEYADMNRGQLLYKIRDLEEKIQESHEKKARTKKEFSPEDQQSKDEFRRRSISTGLEVPGAIVLKGTTSQKLAQLQEREAGLLEEREKQRNVIERLKEDRTHYRAVADDLREKLKMCEEELERLRNEKSPSSQRRQSTTSLSSLRRSSSAKETPSAESKGDDLDRMLEEFQQQRAAKTLQRQWRGYKGRQVEQKGRLLREQQNQAAATLQRNWRKHRHEAKRQSQEEAVTEIQAALRGHAVRCQRLEQLGGELEIADTEEAIVNIQSALRAHAARTRHQEDRGNTVASRDLGRSHAHFIAGPESDEDAGGNSSDLSSGKRDPGPASSRQRRSSLTALQGLGTSDKPVASLAGVAAQHASPQLASGENPTAVLVPVKPATAQLVPAEIATTQLAPAEIATAQLAPVEITTAQLAPQEHVIEPIASKQLVEVKFRPAQLAAAEHPPKLLSQANLVSTVNAQTDFLRNQSESDSDDDAVVIGRSARSKTGNRQLGVEQRERTLLSCSKSHNVNESTPVTESVGENTKKRRGKQHVKKEEMKTTLESGEDNLTAVPQEEVDGSRRSLISAPRFSNISEQSDEDDVVMTSSSRTKPKARTEATRVLKSSNNIEKKQRKKKNTFEIVDSDDDNDDDSVITPPRRSLDTGLSPPRLALVRSNRELGPSIDSPKESLVSSGRLDHQPLEFNKDETVQSRGLSRSKRPVSAERPSLSRKDNTTKGLISSESASSGWARTSMVSEEDSDEDDVVITSHKTKAKPASGDGKVVRPTLTRKSPTKKLPMSSERESITTSLDNFFSSTGPSKGSSRNKFPRRSKGHLSDSEDDDDDDDDEIVVSSRKNASSTEERKSSRERKDSRDSVSSLWAFSDKASNSFTKRKLSSGNSSLRSSRNWGQGLEFERSSGRPESQLDELF